MAQENNILDNWSSPLSDTRNDMVFADRNKKYGAFILRKKYRETVLIAFAITAFAGIAATAIPLLISKYAEDPGKKAKTQKVEVINIEPPPPPKDEPPPPPPAPKEPEVRTIEFTEVKVDNEAQEEVRPIIEDNEAQISTETNEDGESGDDVIDIDDNSGNNDDEGPKLTYQRKVEIDAQYPDGGDDGFNLWLSETIVYPPSAVEANAQGRVWLEFTVDLDGRIGNIKVMSGVNEAPELAIEAVKVLRQSKNWVPAVQNGRSVPAYRQVPIDFVLNQ